MTIVFCNGWKNTWVTEMLQTALRFEGGDVHSKRLEKDWWSFDLAGGLERAPMRSAKEFVES